MNRFGLVEIVIFQRLALKAALSFLVNCLPWDPKGQTW